MLGQVRLGLVCGLQCATESTQCCFFSIWSHAVEVRERTLKKSLDWVTTLVLNHTILLQEVILRPVQTTSVVRSTSLQEVGGSGNDAGS
jgi:hypothetical protein